MADLGLEEAIVHEHGFTHIAGLDEAGRGALAGPVVAAAVILPLDAPQALAQLTEVNDSKQLTAAVRERLFVTICELAVAYGIGAAPASTIDQIGILPATKQAMLAALAQLGAPAEYLLIDGRLRLPQTALPQQAVIRGDSKSLSIAAASILAKVARDREMVALDAQFPAYGFRQHKGYGTAFHRDALAQLGPTPLHRYSFAPLRARLV